MDATQAAALAGGVLLAGALLGPLALGLILVRVVRAWARRVGFVDHSNERKFHEGIVAYGGGLAIFGALWLSVWGGVAAVWVAAATDAAWLPEGVAAHMGGLLGKVGELGVLFGGSLVLLVVGYIDDRRGLGPLFKLIVQIAVALAAALAGVRLTAFLPWPAAQVALTVVWIVCVTNSFNLLDNMDGLSSGVAAIACGAFALVALQSGQWFVALFLLALVGSLLGFLWYNASPASIFMGDTGTLPIGFLLAALTIKGTYHQAGGAGAHAVLLPLLVLAVPLFDTISVLLLRIRMGKPIYIGDTNHFSHRLVRMGFSPARAVLVFYLMTMITGVAALMLIRVDDIGAVLIALQVLLVLLLAATLERASRLTRERRENGE